MKGKLEVFISTFIGYILISLIWNGWSLTGKQLAELIVIGTVSSLLLALAMNRTTRPITRLVEKILKK